MTKTNSETIAAIDIGYSAIKACIAGGKEIHLPSGAAPAEMVPVSMTDAHDKQPLTIRGVSYLAGLERDGTDYQRHSAGQFAMSMDYHALLLEALEQLGERNVSRLVLGLPSREFDSDVKDYLKDTFKGEHEIRGVKFNVGQVLVADQPIGTAAVYYRDHEDDLKMSRLLIIDIGYGTCDIALVVRGAVDRSASASFGSAMRKVCESAARAISSKDAKVSAEFIDERLRKGEKTIPLRGERLTLQDVIETPAKEVAAEIVNSTLGKIGSFARIQDVVITGGGAVVLGEHIKPLIKGPTVSIMNDPVTANLRGFVALANGHG
jgi:plasmid segregation protein ParM